MSDVQRVTKPDEGYVIGAMDDVCIPSIDDYETSEDYSKALVKMFKENYHMYLSTNLYRYAKVKVEDKFYIIQDDQIEESHPPSKIFIKNDLTLSISTKLLKEIIGDFEERLKALPHKYPYLKDNINQNLIYLTYLFKHDVIHFTFIKSIYNLNNLTVENTSTKNYTRMYVLVEQV